MCPKRVLWILLLRIRACNKVYIDSMVMFRAVCESWTKDSGLKYYFQSENFADRRFKRLKTSFNDPMTLT